ncbi:MAG: cell division protein SepF [Propionibacteriaceae bacterium]|nr:cell division protein SepF [Propionibacteriaceae bacterium]
MMGRLRNAAEWFGLTTSERYEDSYDYDSDVELTEDVDPGPLTEDSASVHELEPRRNAARNVEAVPRVVQPTPKPRNADMSRIITVHPRTYNEARTIGEHFREGVPVIMNLTEMDDSDAKRLVDFAAGLIFGLRGTIERVTSKVFLLSPNNVNVTAEDKERIAGGFFNQS